MSLKVGDCAEVVIDNLAYGGQGVARHEGQVLFVALTAPGDRVLVRVTQVHRRFASGVLERLLEPGEARRDPRCPAFGSCGGCQWLHVTSAAQAQAKEEALFSALGRIGKVQPELLDPIVAAGPGEELGYRSRALLRGRSAGGKATFGFLAAGGHSLIPLPETCLVLEDALDRVVRDLTLRSWPPGPFKCELTAMGAGRVHVTLHVQGNREGYRRALSDYPHRILDDRGRVLHDSEPAIRFAYELQAAEGRVLHLEVRPGDFSQVHRVQNQRLVDRVLRYAAVGSQERVLDLYCGAGNLALPLAVSARSVTGVERSAGSVEDARANAAANALAGCEFYASEVKSFLEREGDGRFDVAVLDPPRSGASEAIEALARKAVARIVYASCNPSTLARDAALLAERGYRLLRAGAIDMFPQTYHVEAVALFARHPPARE